MDDLYDALKGMSLEKSPGEDGLTVEFYRLFWNDIKQLVYNSVQFSFNSGRMSLSQCWGIVKLLPKPGRNAQIVSNWRPITLLNVDYKLVTKCLSLRLSLVLPDLISHDQRGFVKGCYIGNNIMDLYACIKEAQMYPNEASAAILLHIEKAFDSVSLTFLHDVLEAFDFPDYFRSWIQILYLNKEIRIVNNGHASEVIKPTNGVAQGCGLSPMLYILVMEILSLSIKNNESIKGICVDNFEKNCLY